MMNALDDPLGPHSALSSLCILFAKEEEVGPKALAEDGDFSLAKLQFSPSF
jgi:hypothetical protein